LKKYFIYVDGFNLYHRCLKNTKYKWLNLRALAESFNFKDCQITKVRYFTAKVIPSRNNPQIASRQNFYLRALQTIPEIQIHLGQFKKREIKGKLIAENNPLHNKIVKVSKFEEKGSDVNIATFMLIDCLQKRCDIPVLLSNDSDLSEPLKFIKTVLRKRVGVITPAEFFTNQLKRYTSFSRKISEKQLRESQFPYTLKDKDGQFSCPKDWV